MTVFGHDAQTSAFRAAIANNRLHHAWLLTGPRGIGKARFAEAILGSLLDGEHDARLLAAGNHPDVYRLERLTNEKTGTLARSIVVDQVRWLRERLTTATALGGRRVVIIDAVDDLEGRGGPNALLKSLEEPPASTVFLLISHAPGRLLPTIRSRCRTLAFAALDDAGMQRALTDALPNLSEGERDALIVGARGIPAVAIASAALEMTAIEATLQAIAAKGDPSNALRGQLAQVLSTKASQPRYEAFVARVPTFIAEAARVAQGNALVRALDAWHRARTFAAIALSQSLVAETVVFELAGQVAALADSGADAKA
ncbi:MAG: AAA family ATPase [Sphingomonadaceae bacterium]